ncbi:MAG: tetratricopeptide repeat protein [Candidatus Fermentibacteraceae bacterium]|nr:tetratricopeptide repeat protein [Candidatus Fermentibacteraceae bacterium]MBN2609283.1 tetratricopeptide repeat protein [Candidatus Fermentibacteraceae bacterium]
MMRFFIASACLMLLACGTAVAQGDQDASRIGIVPFGYCNSDSRWVSEKLYDNLQDILEESTEYVFISEGDLEDAFEDQGFNCSQFEYGVPPDFVVSAGVALDADMILYGNVSQVGEMFQVAWNIAIPASGNTINADPSMVPKNSEPVKDLSREIVDQIEELVGGRTQQALDQAAFSVQMQNWSMAIMFLKQALAVDPTLLEARFLLAHVYLEAEVDSVDKALEIYEEIIAQEPGNADALTGMGQVYLAQGDAATAKTYFENAVGIDSENADAYLGLAQAYQALGELGQAIASFESALVSNPNNLSIKFPLSLLYFQTEDYARAIPYMEEILAVSSNMHGLRQRLIQSYVRTGDYGKAADHAVIYLEADPDNSQRILYTAQVESWAGRTTSAVNRLESLISSTGSREAYILLASIYRDSGQRGAMQNIFSRLSSAYPNDPLANYMMGAFYYQSGSDKARVQELIAENVPTWQSAVSELNTAISYLSQVTGSRAGSAQTMINAANNAISLCEEKIDRVQRYSQ